MTILAYLGSPESPGTATRIKGGRTPPFLPHVGLYLRRHSKGDSTRCARARVWDPQLGLSLGEQRRIGPSPSVSPPAEKKMILPPMTDREGPLASVSASSMQWNIVVKRRGRKGMKERNLPPGTPAISVSLISRGRMNGTRRGEPAKKAPLPSQTAISGSLDHL